MATLPEPTSTKKPKRGNNEGSIYFQASRQRWVGAVTLADGSKKALYGPTRPALSKKLSKALVQVDQGLPFTPETLTVAVHLSHWLADVKPTVKPKTYRSYESLVRVHLVPSLGKIRLARLTQADIKRMLAQCESAGSSPRTSAYVLAVLSMALSRAVEAELLARNVASLVKPPRQVHFEIEPLDTSSVHAMLKAAQGHRFEYLFGFLLGTGLRLGEALALTWKDVDVDQASLTVRHTLERIAGQPWRITEPKSASGRRIVPLIGPTVDGLRMQKRKVLKLHMAAEEWQNLDLVFPNVDGKPLDGTNVSHEFKKVLARAGLPTSTRVHDLRHGAATYLLAAGVNPRVVMQIMGWSQMSMLSRYQHVMNEMLADARTRLEAVFPTTALG